MGKKVLVTGGAGFIGSNFVRMLIDEPDIEKIVVLDKLTYAGSLDNLNDVLQSEKIEFIRGDISNENDVRSGMEDAVWVINFAAESHVDRSLADASPFMRTNVEGVRVMLELARQTKPEKFLHISTDEVYGPVLYGETDESSLLKHQVRILLLRLQQICYATRILCPSMFRSSLLAAQTTMVHTSTLRS